MTKLKRTYEVAEEDGRSVEEVALERYGSLAAFEEALEERRILDDRAGRRANRGGSGSTGPRGDGAGRQRDDGWGRQGNQERFMFNDMGGESRSSSRGSFRRPGQADSLPSTPQPSNSRKDQQSYFDSATQPAANKRLDALRGRPPLQSGNSSPNDTKPSTPIPSVMTPNLPGPRALSPSSLNKLQAKVLRAKLMGQDGADDLEKQYEEELNRAKGQVAEGGQGGSKRVQVTVLPTLDGRGQLYDVGLGKDDGGVQPGNKKKKEMVRSPP